MVHHGGIETDLVILLIALFSPPPQSGYQKGSCKQSKNDRLIEKLHVLYWKNVSDKKKSSLIGQAAFCGANPRSDEKEEGTGEQKQGILQYKMRPIFCLVGPFVHDKSIEEK